jgi:Rrf2 family protein
MQITRQADYALRAMLYLARLDDSVCSATRKIAKEMQIPPSFLAKIISQLSIAGLIHTSRGAHGGILLAHPAAEITFLQVIEAIDGPISLNQCTLAPGSCNFSDNCPMHPIWCDLQDQLITRLRNITFGEIIAPTTTQGQDYPTRVKSQFEGKEGQLVLDQIRTMDKNRFVKKLGEISAKAQNEVLEVLKEVFAE